MWDKAPKKEHAFSLPPIGLRIIKSAIGVALCYLVYFLRGQKGIVFYSQIAVIWCMQPYVGSTMKMAYQRFLGTFIGAFFGFLVIVVSQGFDLSLLSHTIFYDIFISVMIIPVIYTTILINEKSSSYFSCVVFLSIVVNHISDVQPLLFVWNRVLDTTIGLLVGMAVNSFRIPRRKREDILFVSGLDDTLLIDSKHLTAYSKVELNRLLENGIKFVISTRRTPASIIPTVQDLHINLPVIAMDGAVLYDLKEKQYIHSYVISSQMTRELLSFISSHHLNCFINVIWDDMLVIYYDEFQNSVQENIYQSLRHSPYRNFVKRKLPEGEDIIYLMLVDKKEVMQAFYEELVKQGYTTKLKIQFYDSSDYEGYSYIKIYNKNATKQNMLDYLKKSIDVKETVSFGSVEGMYDVVIRDGDSNKVVKTLKKMYEPYFFSKDKSI